MYCAALPPYAVLGFSFAYESWDPPPFPPEAKPSLYATPGNPLEATPAVPFPPSPPTPDTPAPPPPPPYLPSPPFPPLGPDGAPPPPPPEAWMRSTFPGMPYTEVVPPGAPGVGVLVEPRPIPPAPTVQRSEVKL